MKKKIQSKRPWVLLFEPFRWKSHCWVMRAVAQVLENQGARILSLSHPDEIRNWSKDIAADASSIVLLPNLGEGLAALKILRLEFGLDVPAILQVASDLNLGGGIFVEHRRTLTARDFFVGCSGPELALIGRAFPGNRKRKIPYPVLSPFFGPVALRQRKPGPARILFAGRFTEQKNIEGLLETFARTLDAVDSELWLAGDFDNEFHPVRGVLKKAEYEKRVRRKIRGLGLSKKVRFLGPQPREKVRRLMEGADVQISLSLYHREEFGYALAEGFSLGLPAVASRWGGFKDFIENGAAAGVDVRIGRLGPEIDPDHASRQTLNVLSYREEWSERASTYAEARLSGEAVGALWSDLFKDVFAEISRGDLEIAPHILKFYLETVIHPAVQRGEPAREPVFSSTDHSYHRWVLRDYAHSPR